MKKIKLNVKVKDNPSKNNPPRKISFSANPNPDSIKTQSITNNYYSVQNNDYINYPDLSDDFRRDARRYPYSLEVQL